MLRDKLKKTVSDLLEIGPRAPGSLKELEAAEYVKKRFTEIGLDANIERVKSASHLAKEASLENLDSGENFEALPVQFSPAGNVKGKLLFLGYEKNPAIDLNSDLSEKIGLLSPNSATHKERIEYLLNLEKQGLEGLIVATPLMDMRNSKILRYPEIKKLPIITVSWRDACKLSRCKNQTFHLNVDHESGQRNETVNVVAKLKGESENWIAVSAHIDSAAFSPGALDNAAGAAMLLELAEYFSGKKFPANIIFAATGSEEYGMTDMCGAGGEGFYKARESELENCVAHIEIDDIGNCLGMLDLEYGGCGKFKELISQTKSSVKFKMRENNTPGCDHGAAVKRGIPYAWFCDAHFTRPQYHTPHDNLEFADFEKMASYFNIIKDTVETLAKEKPFYPWTHDDERTIRPAHYSDIPAICEITKQAFGPVNHDRMIRDFFGEKSGGKDWHEYKNAEIEAQCKGNIYWVIVCEIENKVVGYATYILDPKRGIAEIGNNAVLPEFQGKGIGKAMQREAQRRMDEEGFSKFKVTTLSNDIAAQKVYEKLGYKKYIESYHYLK